MVDFNSIKVRLRLSAAIGAAGGLLFQFHKGSIKTPSKVEGIVTRPNFNSIKVRLRQLAGALEPAKTIFQFHKGSIKTC